MTPSKESNPEVRTRRLWISDISSTLALREFEPTLRKISQFNNLVTGRPQVLEAMYDAEEKYYRLFGDGDFSNATVGMFNDPRVTPDDGEVLKSVYNSFVRERSVTRSAYDSLRLFTNLGTCIYCNLAPPDTLDHLMPKSLFPILCLLPINLVGSCDPCNRRWNSSLLRRRESFHPILSTVDLGDIAAAEVASLNPLQIRFSFTGHAALGSADLDRIAKQAGHLKLGQRMILSATDAIVEIVGFVRQMNAMGLPPANIEKDLRSHISQYRTDDMSEAVKYKVCNCLISSDEFLGGQFEGLDVGIPFPPFWVD